MGGEDSTSYANARSTPTPCKSFPIRQGTGGRAGLAFFTVPLGPAAEYGGNGVTTDEHRHVAGTA
jgi:hypothetical protein